MEFSFPQSAHDFSPKKMRACQHENPIFDPQCNFCDPPASPRQLSGAAPLFCPLAGHLLCSSPPMFLPTPMFQTPPLPLSVPPALPPALCLPLSCRPAFPACSLPSILCSLAFLPFLPSSLLTEAGPFHARPTQMLWGEVALQSYFVKADTRPPCCLYLLRGQ